MLQRRFVGSHNYARIQHIEVHLFPAKRIFAVVPTFASPNHFVFWFAPVAPLVNRYRRRLNKLHAVRVAEPPKHKPVFRFVVALVLRPYLFVFPLLRRGRALANVAARLVPALVATVVVLLRLFPLVNAAKKRNY